MAIYASMLEKECGIITPTPALTPAFTHQPTPALTPAFTTKLTPVRVNYKCCGQIDEDRVNGCYTCTNCGLVVCDKLYDSQEEHPSKPHLRQTYVTMYRPYKSLTHFREHYRRYAGHRWTDIPDKLLLDLKPLVGDPMNRDAYTKVKKSLQQLRQNRYPVRFYDKKYKIHKTKLYPPQKFYKDIFLIIYKLGGVQPNLNNIHSDRIYNQYKIIEYTFRQLPEKTRRNMPSHFYILQELLKLNGHEPYYIIPQLKAFKLRSRVEKIYTSIINMIPNLKKFLHELQNRCRCVCLVQCCITNQHPEYEGLFPEGIIDEETSTSSASGADTPNQHTYVQRPNIAHYQKDKPCDSSQSLLSHSERSNV